jgi:predicted transposase/invertase (TIGR01784 family)
METNNQNPAQYEWGPFPFGDGERIYDIRYDPVFKAVFTKDTYESRGALSGLISTLIGHTVAVEAINANEPPIDDLRQRYIRFDVSCRTEKDELVNVEMSFNPGADEQARIEYYTARLFTGQDIHGKNKNYNDLKKTYQITILAKEIFFPDEELIHDFSYSDLKTHVSFAGKTRIITVELEKTKPIAEKPVEEMTKAELWAVFFEYLTDSEKRAKIIDITNREESIAFAVKTMTGFTQNELDYMRETARIKSELDYQSLMTNAERKGLEKGLEKGLKEGLKVGLIEGHKEVLELIAQGLSVDEIKERLKDS